MKFLRKIQRACLYVVGGYRRSRLECIGSVDQWVCDVTKIDEHSKVVSGGVGQNITFEKILSQQTGCSVYLYDPSPTGVLTMGEPDNLSPKLYFSPVGIAANDAVYSFSEPDRVEEGSWKIAKGEGAIQFRCISVSSMLAEYGWEKIDLLKLDIEGFEYEVLDSILSRGLIVDQVCVEFHTSVTIDINRSPFDVLKMCLKMRAGGYHLVNIVKADFTFIHQRCFSD